MLSTKSVLESPKKIRNAINPKTYISILKPSVHFSRDVNFLATFNYMILANSIKLLIQLNYQLYPY